MSLCFYKTLGCSAVHQLISLFAVPLTNVNTVQTIHITAYKVEKVDKKPSFKMAEETSHRSSQEGDEYETPDVPRSPKGKGRMILDSGGAEDDTPKGESGNDTNGNDAATVDTKKEGQERAGNIVDRSNYFPRQSIRGPDVNSFSLISFTQKANVFYRHPLKTARTAARALRTQWPIIRMLIDWVLEAQRIGTNLTSSSRRPTETEYSQSMVIPSIGQSEQRFKEPINGTSN